MSLEHLEMPDDGSDPYQWTPNQVAAYMRSVNLPEKYLSVFIEEEINGMVLMNLTKEELKDEPFAMEGFAPVKTVTSTIATLKDAAKQLKDKSDAGDAAAGTPPAAAPQPAATTTPERTEAAPVPPPAQRSTPPSGGRGERGGKHGRNKGGEGRNGRHGGMRNAGGGGSAMNPAAGAFNAHAQHAQLYNTPGMGQPGDMAPFGLPGGFPFVAGPGAYGALPNAAPVGNMFPFMPPPPVFPDNNVFSTEELARCITQSCAARGPMSKQAWEPMGERVCE